MSTSINPIGAGVTPDTSGTTTPTSGITQVANMNTFLQLLVAQLKNQNPMQPTDGTQFVAQLAQFSSLEQELGIRSNTQTMAQELQQLVTAQTPTTTTTTTTTNTSNTGGGSGPSA